MNELTNPEDKRMRAGKELIIRILATGAVWSIAAVVSLRLRHPVIRLTLVALATAITILIWTHNSKRGD